MDVNRKSNLYQDMPPEEMKAIVSKYFPKESILACDPVSGGLFNTVYRFTVNSGTYILRAAPVNRTLLMDFEHGMMEAEAYVYGLMEAEGIPCPEVVVCDASRDILDRDYMITRFVEALPLLDDVIPQQDRPAIRIEVGQYMKKLHGITGNCFGRVTGILAGQGFDTWDGYVFDEMDRLGKRCQAYDLISHAHWQEVSGAFERHGHVLCEVTTPLLNHGDLWAGNLLCQEQGGVYRLKAIIDADRAVFGDPEFDIATGYMMSDYFFQGYGKPMDMSHGAQIRRELYKMLFHLIEVYVRGAQYNEQAQYEKEKNALLCMARRMLDSK